MNNFEKFNVICKRILSKPQLANFIVSLETREELMETIHCYLIRMQVELLK